MILKFTHTLQLSEEASVIIGSEAIADTEDEARMSGRAFYDLIMAFLKGYEDGNEEWSAENKK